MILLSTSDTGQVSLAVPSLSGALGTDDFQPLLATSSEFCLFYDQYVSSRCLLAWYIKSSGVCYTPLCLSVAICAMPGNYVGCKGLWQNLLPACACNFWIIRFFLLDFEWNNATFNERLSVFWFVDKRDNVESNPFIAATIAVSVIAAVAIIVAVILLIMLLKRQSDNKRLYRLCSFYVDVFFRRTKAGHIMILSSDVNKYSKPTIRRIRGLDLHPQKTCFRDELHSSRTLWMSWWNSDVYRLHGSVCAFWTLAVM